MITITDKLSEVSLYLIKPDAIKQGEERYAIKRILEKGLEIYSKTEISFTPDMAWKFYEDRHDNKFGLLLEYITSGKSIALIVTGEECCKRLNELKKEMRLKFIHGDINTGTHSSDTPLLAKREIDILKLLYPFR